MFNMMALDTIDHQRLLHTLESSFGIKGKVLDWFQSYVAGRTQTVHIKKQATGLDARASRVK